METNQNTMDGNNHADDLAKSLFDVCDVANQGYIERSDLEILCQKKLIPISIEEAHQLFYLLDVNGDGVVTIEEFMSCFEDTIGIAIQKQRHQVPSPPHFPPLGPATHYEHSITYHNDYLEFFHNHEFEG